MGKIKGWKKITRQTKNWVDYEAQNETSDSFVLVYTDAGIPKNIGRYVVAYGKEPNTKYKYLFTKKEAMDFASLWMKAHPRG